MNTIDEYVLKRIDLNWSIEERITKIKEILEDCPIKASAFCNALSTDDVIFSIKYTTIDRKRKAYLDINYKNK